MIEQTAHSEGASILNFHQSRNDPELDSAPIAGTDIMGLGMIGKRRPTRLDRACNMTIAAIIIFPFLLAIAALFRRLL